MGASHTAVKCTAQSDPELKRWYAYYRKKYFDNRLPETAEVDIYYAEMPELYGYADSDDDPPEHDHFIIEIERWCIEHPIVAKMTLLHEMAHLATFPYEGHGEPFQKEMLRLAKLGAFRRLW
jgi:hypothetical protein